VAKGTILLERNELPDRTFFVVKGCLRSYFIDAKGKEHVFMFAPEGWIIGDVEAQINNTPAELVVDAIEDSEIEVIDKALFEDLYMGPYRGAGVNIDKLLRRISVLQRRVLMLMSASAKERYQHFIDIYPNIVQRVPQKMIASYLGITPEALSRIKHDMAKPHEAKKARLNTSKAAQ
jgi:CRP-like cAMP-binding protein